MYKPGSPSPGSRALTQPQFAKRLLDEQAVRLPQDMAGLASEIGCTVSQLTLAWVMRRPGITSGRVTELSAAFVAF